MRLSLYMPGSDGSVLYYVSPMEYSFAWSSQYAVLILGRYLYVVGVSIILVSPKYAKFFLKKMLPQSDSVLNGFGDDTFHASCTLVFYSYSDGNINTIH